MCLIIPSPVVKWYSSSDPLWCLNLLEKNIFLKLSRILCQWGVLTSFLFCGPGTGINIIIFTGNPPFRNLEDLLFADGWDRWRYRLRDVMKSAKREVRQVGSSLRQLPHSLVSSPLSGALCFARCFKNSTCRDQFFFQNTTDFKFGWIIFAFLSEIGQISFYKLMSKVSTKSENLFWSGI